MSVQPIVELVDVDCYAGYRGEETPRRFRLGARQVDVADVVDRWLAPDHRYFKVLDPLGDTYILRHDVASGRWELTSFVAGADAGTWTPPQRPPGSEQ
jgi:hypothetical protein